MQKSVRIGRRKRLYVLAALLIAAAFIVFATAEKRVPETDPEGAVFAYSRSYIVRSEEGSLCA